MSGEIDFRLSDEAGFLFSGRQHLSVIERCLTFTDKISIIVIILNQFRRQWYETLWTERVTEDVSGFF